MSKRNSREIALKILYQIHEEGAYANLALDKALFSCQDLDPRDKGLITEIVYGSVKNRGKLDYVLNQFAKIKVKKMDRWTRNILRMALYQIMFLDKVPDSAAVDEAVKLSKRYGRSDKFVNAVLRQLFAGTGADCMAGSGAGCNTISGGTVLLSCVDGAAVCAAVWRRAGRAAVSVV